MIIRDYTNVKIQETDRFIRLVSGIGSRVAKLFLVFFLLIMGALLHFMLNNGGVINRLLEIGDIICIIGLLVVACWIMMVRGREFLVYPNGQI